jgi:hypothetical protein
MPGEVRSCIGCHEPRNNVPSVHATLAQRQPAQQPLPQPGETGPWFVHYPRDVQPIFDKHCVRCHSGEKPKAGLDLSGEPTTLFCRSYENLIRQKLINHIDVDPRSAYIPAEPPLTFGSHRSKVVGLLRKGHQEVKLGREEFIRFVTWIDGNAPYYGIYEGKKNLRWKGAPDFRPEPPRVLSAVRFP